MDHLQLFNQSLSVIQSFIADFPSVSNTNDSYTDSDDSFLMCEIQEQAVTSLPKSRPCADLSVSTGVIENIYT